MSVAAPDRYRPTPLGRCACGAPVDAASFRDRQSYLEWWIHPACQACQDSVFLARDEATGAALPLRRGVVAAYHKGEFAALPFVFTRAGGPRAWEPRFAVRVGAEAPLADPFVDLAPMRDVLHDHQIRVYSARRYWYGVGHRLVGTELVVTFDASMACALRRHAPVLASSDCVALADTEVLHAMVGLSREALVGEVFPDPSECAIPSVPANALAFCARLGAVLADATLVGFAVKEAVFDDVLRFGARRSVRA